MTEVCVHLPKQFTPHVAVALHRLMERVPAGTTLALDFSGVRDCQEPALLLLARDVVTGAVRYVLRGLTQHQRTLFGYLGVRPPPAEEVEPVDDFHLQPSSYQGAGHS
jgi:hypothetical protein